MSSTKRKEIGTGKREGAGCLTLRQPPGALQSEQDQTERVAAAVGDNEQTGAAVDAHGARADTHDQFPTFARTRLATPMMDLGVPEIPKARARFGTASGSVSARAIKSPSRATPMCFPDGSFGISILRAIVFSVFVV